MVTDKRERKMGQRFAACTARGPALYYRLNLGRTVTPGSHTGNPPLTIATLARLSGFVFFDELIRNGDQT